MQPIINIQPSRCSFAQVEAPEGQRSVRPKDAESKGRASKTPMALALRETSSRDKAAWALSILFKIKYYCMGTVHKAELLAAALIYY